MKNLKMVMYVLPLVCISFLILSWTSINKRDNNIQIPNSEGVESPTSNESMVKDKVIVTESKGSWLDNGGGDVSCQLDGKCYDVIVIGNASNIEISGDPEGAYFEVTSTDGNPFIIAPNNGTDDEIHVERLIQQKDADGVKHLSFN